MSGQVTHMWPEFEVETFDCFPWLTVKPRFLESPLTLDSLSETLYRSSKMLYTRTGNGFRSAVILVRHTLSQSDFIPGSDLFGDCHMIGDYR